jgi:hypothetical protein
MKKNYGLLAGCLLVAALGVIYAGVRIIQRKRNGSRRRQKKYI